MSRENVLPFRRPEQRDHSDETLVLACAGGDGRALEELFHRHGPQVYRILGRLGHVDRRDLEDLVQVTFLEIHRSAGRFSGRSAVGTWIISVALNVARHHARSESRRRTAMAAATRVTLVPEAHRPDNRVSHRQSLERLRVGIEALPYDFRVGLLALRHRGAEGDRRRAGAGYPRGDGVAAAARGAHAAARVRRHGGRALSSRAMSWFGRLARPSCPPGWKLTRAITEGVDSRTEWHVMRCERCSAEYRALQALVQDAKAAAPVPEALSREARAEIGARLRTLASVPDPERARPGRARRFTVLWLALVTPAIAAAILWTGRRADHAVIARGDLEAPIGDSRATIRAIGPARFSRAQFQPDEIVRLDDGEIELEIAPLHAGERFRVVAADGEVEVRGTRFKVSVIDHHLTAVHVWRGKVEVRSSDGAQAILVPGDDWVRAEPPVASAPEIVAPPPPPVADGTIQRRAPTHGSPPSIRRHAKAKDLPRSPGAQAFAGRARRAAAGRVAIVRPRLGAAAQR